MAKTYFLDLLKHKNLSRALKKELQVQLIDSTRDILMKSISDYGQKKLNLYELKNRDGAAWINELLRQLISSSEAYVNMTAFLKQNKKDADYLPQFEQSTQVDMRIIENSKRHLTTEITVTPGSDQISQDLYRLLAINFIGGEWASPGYWNPEANNTADKSFVFNASPGYNSKTLALISQQFQKYLLSQMEDIYMDKLTKSGLKDAIKNELTKTKINGS
jgi:hypothetical protein